MFRSWRGDPVDAALRGDPVDDPALRALIGDLRAAYVPDRPPQRSAELVAYAGDGSEAPLRPSTIGLRQRRSWWGRVAAAVGAFVATVGGKALLGGAVATAAVGGLHAAEVVDVPLLPDVGTNVEEPTESQPGDPAEPVAPVVPEPGAPGPVGAGGSDVPSESDPPAPGDEPPGPPPEGPPTTGTDTADGEGGPPGDVPPTSVDGPPPVGTDPPPPTGDQSSGASDPAGAEPADRSP